MANIVYYLGAGASYPKIPLALKLKEKFEDIQKYVSQWSDPKNEFPSKLYGLEFKAIRDQLVSDIEWLRNESYYHKTVDTLAKKLYVTRQLSELDRLRRTLMASFAILNHIQNNPENKYDSFFATIIGSRGKLPGNIDILTWNYDLELEFSIGPYKQHDEFRLANSSLNDQEYIRSAELQEDTKFRILRLNGHSSFFDNEIRHKQYLNRSIAHYNSPLDQIEFLSNYSKLCDYNTNCYTNINFAFETDTWRKQTIDKALSILRSAQVVVIIGYSFPDFNREVDMHLFYNAESVRRIYIQDPNAENVRQRISSILPSVDYRLSTDEGQFWIPDEYFPNYKKRLDNIVF